MRHLREHVLQQPRWATILADMTERNVKTKKRKTPEQLKRGAWNAVLCTIESEVVAALISFINSATVATAVMPSYDGVLVKHGDGAFRWGVELNQKWTEISQ